MLQHQEHDAIGDVERLDRIARGGVANEDHRTVGVAVLARRGIDRHHTGGCVAAGIEIGEARILEAVVVRVLAVLRRALALFDDALDGRQGRCPHGR